MRERYKAMIRDYLRLSYRCVLFLLISLASVLPVASQTCTMGPEMDPATRSAVESAAHQYFNMAVQGDIFGLKQNSIPAIANDFSGIERAVIDNRAVLSGDQPAIRNTYLLDLPGAAAQESAEFFCGVFGANGQTPNSAGFRIPNLPPGRYAIVVQDVQGTKGPAALTLVLQQLSTGWKLGGFYAKLLQVGGHDGEWFANMAREFKNKGQMHNAWFYYMQARDLLAPVPFISTLKLDRLYDEAQQVMPKDIPISGPVNFAGSDGRTYEFTSMFPVVVGDELNLVVRYQSADVSDSAKAFQENTALMRALVARYPEYREGFQAIVARAVAPSGQDYGTLLAMKDIK
ncbi:MAG TPA: hypothetical protein VN622_03110 [Clostridia bacterium]|nr:hypothetical protein [Clostridia bacterium]